MKKTALVVVDVQNVMFREQESVYEPERLLDVLQDLIQRARASAVPVVYVQHDAGSGSLLERGTPAWDIHAAIAPQTGDVIVHKRYPDSFHQTTLQEELTQLGVDHLVITGCQTEICVDTTSRRAFSMGYDLTFVSDGHSTFDKPHLTAAQMITHHNDIMRRFADVVTAEDVKFFS